ncbi:MAG TPA: transposase [Pseudonocardiaceae bacterium]|nr:transposase [Pseudonocardiaceae bacterium]
MRSDAVLTEQLDAHADAHIFTSLPRSGRVRAARLLTEIGDCRARFPTPEALFCLAGAGPSTRQPGTVKVVSSAGRATNSCATPSATSPDSRTANPWATKLYTDAIARGHDHPHAVRLIVGMQLTASGECQHQRRSIDQRFC